MWRWSHQWTMVGRRSQLEDVDSRILGMLDAKDCVRLEEGHHESTLPEESQSGGAKDPNGRPIFRGRQIAFMICEYFRVTGAHEAVLDYSDLFCITLHGDDVQDFDTIWDRSFIINQ